MDTVKDKLKDLRTKLDSIPVLQKAEVSSIEEPELFSTAALVVLLRITKFFLLVVTFEESDRIERVVRVLREPDYP